MRKLKNISLTKYEFNERGVDIGDGGKTAIVKTIIMEGRWNLSGTTFKCSIENGGRGDNRDQRFCLTLDDGQIERGELVMSGPLERQEFTELLQLILSEFKK